MATLGSGRTTSINIRKQKRTGLVAEELKRLIVQRDFKSGNKLPRGIKLQETFEVSKGAIREVFKSLEVRGLVSVSMGPTGGGAIVEVPLDHTFRLIQNCLFFRDIGIADVYTVRCLFEPELAVSAVPHLTEDDFHVLEHAIDLCDPMSTKAAVPLDQRQEGLSLHDILTAANPNPMLRFCCELINEMTRQLMVFGNEASPKDHAKFDASNVRFHRQILDMARARDADIVCALMSTHMDDCTHHVTCMKGYVHGRPVLGSRMSRRHRPLVDDHDDSGHNGHSEDHV